eukprot:858105_1
MYSPSFSISREVPSDFHFIFFSIQSFLSLLPVNVFSEIVTISKSNKSSEKSIATGAEREEDSPYPYACPRRTRKVLIPLLFVDIDFIVVSCKFCASGSLKADLDFTFRDELLNKLGDFAVAANNCNGENILSISPLARAAPVFPDASRRRCVPVISIPRPFLEAS